MRKITNYLVAIAILVGMQGCEAQQNERANRGNRGNFDPVEMAKRQSERLSDALTLTSDQEEKVQSLFLKIGEKQVKIREEAAGDREVMRGQMQKINKEREEGLKGILDETQWSKWEEIRGEFQRRRGQRQN